MNIVDMHFDFKQKMNKVDSKTFINYRIPEIDRFLNEAQILFIKNIVFPRNIKQNITEINQRKIDEIRTLVHTHSQIPVINSKIDLPDDYLFFLNAYCSATKGGNEGKLRVLKRRHSDRIDSDTFYSSSFEWKELVGYFEDNSLVFFTDGSFNMRGVDLTYVRQPAYMHNAKGIRGGTGYALGDGTVLGGTQDCELPAHTHSEIVDIAVMIAKSATTDNQYEASIQKLKVDTLV